MEKEWKLSCYTNIIKCESGDILLHNSFMGAVARIPANKVKNIDKFFQDGIKETDMDNPALKELCEGGFFVPSHIDERKAVTELLDKERESFSYRIIILPHENCNFRCVYCYEKFERGKMKSNIIHGLRALVANSVKESKELIVSWFGGEPLLACDVIYQLSDFFIDHCENNNVKYVSGMTTNGYFLTRDVAHSLLKRKIRSYQITLDGPEKVHNSNRKLLSGGRTYQRILDNLIAMRNMNEKFFVRIRVNFNDTSVPFIEGWLVDEIAPLFANDSRFGLDFQPIGKWGGTHDSKIDVCDSEFASLNRFAFFEKSIALGFSDQVLKQYLMPHGNVCYAGKRSSIVVGSDGTVYKCTREFSDPTNMVGRVTSNGQLIIDEKLSNLWTNLKDKDTSWCYLCSYYPSCQARNCPRISIRQKKPLCYLTRREYESIVKLAVSADRPIVPQQVCDMMDIQNKYLK